MNITEMEIEKTKTFLFKHVYQLIFNNKIYTFNKIFKSWKNGDNILNFNDIITISDNNIFLNKCEIFSVKIGKKTFKAGQIIKVNDKDEKILSFFDLIYNSYNKTAILAKIGEFNYINIEKL